MRAQLRVTMSEYRCLKCVGRDNQLQASIVTEKLDNAMAQKKNVVHEGRHRWSQKPTWQYPRAVGQIYQDNSGGGGGGHWGGRGGAGYFGGGGGGAGGYSTSLGGGPGGDGAVVVRYAVAGGTVTVNAVSGDVEVGDRTTGDTIDITAGGNVTSPVVIRSFM